MNSLGQLQAAHADWIAQALEADGKARDPLWSESLAVGREDFVQNVQAALGVKARYRGVSEAGGAHVLQ